MKKGTILCLAALGALCGGVWIRSEAKQAATEQKRLDAPFREYREKHKRNLKYGETAPDFELKDETGRTYRLSEVTQKAKLTLLSGLRPEENASIRQLIDLREAYLDLKAKGLEILALADAAPAEIADFKRRYAIPFPVLRDDGEKTLMRLGATTQPYSLLLTPERKTLYTSAAYHARLNVSEILDKATLELTGQRLEERWKANPPTLSPDRPLVLNDLSGEPVSLPFKKRMAAVILSTTCSTCPETYERLSRAFKGAKEVPLAIVFADSADQAQAWLTPERRKALPGAKFLADPNRLLMSRLDVKTYGGAVVMDREGKPLRRVDPIEGPEYEREMARLLASKGGER